MENFLKRNMALHRADICQGIVEYGAKIGQFAKILTCPAARQRGLFNLECDGACSGSCRKILRRESEDQFGLSSAAVIIRDLSLDTGFGQDRLETLREVKHMRRRQNDGFCGLPVRIVIYRTKCVQPIADTCYPLPEKDTRGHGECWPKPAKTCCAVKMPKRVNRQMVENF
ncbi:hypothetical protein [Paracoccus aerodenitrificans]|uniref:hypothetical protein n=1 Tax=Paracoccus aerodenitrificans TaxID=3017781 RepID=UPI0022F0E572|nr:hypothetical protein [Paracoccus aerodenitrificans]WBU63263.1 hypothetical protein PAE61_12970 [Paracoccus aerodenitrificans]